MIAALALTALLPQTLIAGDSWKAERTITYTNPAEELHLTEVDGFELVVLKGEKLEVRRRLIETRIGDVRAPASEGTLPSVLQIDLLKNAWAADAEPFEERFARVFFGLMRLGGKVSYPDGVLTWQERVQGPEIAVRWSYAESSPGEPPLAGDAFLHPKSRVPLRMSYQAADVRLPGGDLRAAMRVDLRTMERRIRAERP